MTTQFEFIAVFVISIGRAGQFSDDMVNGLADELVHIIETIHQFRHDNWPFFQLNSNHDADGVFSESHNSSRRKELSANVDEDAFAAERERLDVKRMTLRADEPLGEEHARAVRADGANHTMKPIVFVPLPE